MAPIERDTAETFRIRFAELARMVTRGLKRGAPVQVDPFLIARAIAGVMAVCTVRAASGQRLLWNEYRVVLARADYEGVRSLQGPLERDLIAVLAAEPAVSAAERVGDLRITVVPDDADELPVGEGVVRVGFVPSDQLPTVRAGELTVRFDAVRATGELRAVGPTATVIVDDTDRGHPSYLVRWAGGQAALPIGATLVLGRPHATPPAQFVALTGASARVNKQHLWITASACGVRVGRMARANPVHVNGAPIAAGAEISIAAPAEVSLSRGELVVTIARS